MVGLSIVIVNWNVCDLLRSCLHSIAAGTVLVGDQLTTGAIPVRRTSQPSLVSEPQPLPKSLGPDLWTMEVIVVDSRSTDGSLEMLRREFPWAQIIANTQNVGFIRGSNQGIRASQGRYVLLLNPDTEIVGDALPVMMDYMERHPQVGALGPQLRYPII